MSTERNPTDDFSELLSAYLDGELTAEEQAIVEQRLAESAEFRLLHDELRAVRSGLDLLPRYKLKEDLASAVLRRAERAMLSSPAVLPSDEANSVAVTLADQPTATDRILRGVKMFRWSIIAVAVAVLIMLFNPREQDNEQQVAMHRAEDAVATPAEMSAPPSEMIAAPASEQYAGSTPADGAAVEHKRDASQAPEGFAPKAATAPVPRPMLGESEQVTGKLSEPGPVEKSFEQQQGGGGGLGGYAGAAAPARKSASVAGGKGKEDEAAATMADKENESATDGLLDLQQESSILVRSAIDDGTLIVHCDIRPEALKDGTFEKLLADQQIHLFSGTVEVDRGAAEALRAGDRYRDVDDAKGPGTPAAPPANAITETLEEDGKPAARSFLQKDRADEGQVKKQWSDAPGIANGQAGAGGALTAYLVDASPEKVAATLAELNLRRDEFPTVAVSPSAVDALPEAAQRKLEIPAKVERAAEGVDTSVPGPAGAAIEAVVAEPSAEAAPAEEAAADAGPRGSDVAGDQAKTLRGEAGELKSMTKRTSENLAGARFRAKGGAAVRENAMSAPAVDVARRVSINPAVLDFDGERDKSASRADVEAGRRQLKRGQATAERASAPALVPAETRGPAADEVNRSETGEADLRNGTVVDPQAVAKPGDSTLLRDELEGTLPAANARDGQASSVRVLFLFRVVPESEAAR